MTDDVPVIEFIESYKQTVQKKFSVLKQINNSKDLLLKNIPLIQREDFLIPVCELHMIDESLIEKLAQWREENSFAYPSQFPVTIMGTKNWLRYKVLEVDDRILFLIIDKSKNLIGHLGFSNALNDFRELEMDNIVRGVKKISPGIMNAAMKTLLNWAKQTIKPHLVYLRVFSDNEHAIHFYHKLGFDDDCLIPLRLDKEGEGIYYRPLTKKDNAKPDKYFLRMVYNHE